MQFVIWFAQFCQTIERRQRTQPAPINIVQIIIRLLNGGTPSRQYSANRKEPILLYRHHGKERDNWGKERDNWEKEGPTMWLVLLQ